MRMLHFLLIFARMLHFLLICASMIHFFLICAWCELFWPPLLIQTASCFLVTRVQCSFFSSLYFCKRICLSFAVMDNNKSPSPTPIVSEAGPVMIIGSTGFIGRFVTEACIDSGRLTYLLVRSGLTTPPKAAIVNSFQEKGAIIIHGSVNDQDFMTNVLRKYNIEVVISAIGGDCIIEQLVLVQAIQAAGTVKRFLPSEFGHDIDRADPVEPGLWMYNGKREVRRAIEKAGIPYTYICCNSIAAWPYHDNKHPSDVLPPLDKFQIYGDGSVKAYFVAGSDIGKFTIKAMDDVQTLNKTLHFRPPNNLLNMNDLASLWEKKIGRSIPRVTITEHHLLDAAKEMRIPESIVAALTHDIFIMGCQIHYSLDKPNDVEVCSLYPDTPFISVDECFNDFVAKIVENQKLVNKQQHQPGNNNNNNNNKNGIIIPNSKQEALAIATCS